MKEKTVDEKTVRKAMIDLDETQKSIALRIKKSQSHVNQVLVGTRATPDIVAEFNRIVKLSESIRKAS